MLSGASGVEDGLVTRSGWRTVLTRQACPIRFSQFPLPNCSEHQLQSKLDDPLVPRGQSTGSADVILNFSECSAADRRYRGAGIQMVRKVESLASQLNASALSEKKRS